MGLRRSGGSGRTQRPRSQRPCDEHTSHGTRALHTATAEAAGALHRSPSELLACTVLSLETTPTCPGALHTSTRHSPDARAPGRRDRAVGWGGPRSARSTPPSPRTEPLESSRAAEAKRHREEAATTEIHFLPVLETGSPISRCWQGRRLLRPLPVCGRCLLLCLGPLSSSPKGHRPTDLILP